MQADPGLWPAEEGWFPSEGSLVAKPPRDGELANLPISNNTGGIREVSSRTQGHVEEGVVSVVKNEQHEQLLTRHVLVHTTHNHNTTKHLDRRRTWQNNNNI